jgi:hypothetical protein
VEPNGPSVKAMARTGRGLDPQPGAQPPELVKSTRSLTMGAQQA